MDAMKIKDATVEFLLAWNKYWKEMTRLYFEMWVV